MMKILFAINSLAGGGAQKLLTDLIISLKMKEIDCSVLLLTSDNDKYRKEIESAGVKVDVIPYDVKGTVGRICYLTKYIRNTKPHIVHANLFPTFYYCAISRRLLGRKAPVFIMTEHSTYNRRRNKRLIKPLERYIYRSYDRIICISKATKDALLHWLNPFDAINFEIIENAVTLKNFYQATPYDRSALSKKIIADDRLLCMVGSFTEQKNHDFMIEIMNQLPAEYKLILCGEGKRKDFIRKKVQTKGLEDRILFLGFRKDIPRIMHTSDIVVIPSKWEGFGLVAVEAMACGKPVICFDIPGVAEVVGNGGIKVPSDDHEAFLRAIESLNNQEDYDRYCTEAKNRSKRYDINTMAEHYIEMYDQLLFVNKETMV